MHTPATPAPRGLLLLALLLAACETEPQVVPATSTWCPGPTGAGASPLATLDRPGPREHLDLAPPLDEVETVRALVGAALEPYDPPDPELVVTASTRLPGEAIVREELAFRTFDGELAFAVLLRPDDCVVRPGLLLMHPHDADSSDMTEPRERYARGLALELARAGFVTLTPDIRSFGRFRPGGRRHWGSDGYARAVRVDGDVFVRLAVNDARVALDLLRELPGVDPRRLGMAGLSVGAFITLVTATVEPDLEAVAISGFLVPLDLVMSSKHHYCQHLRPLLDIAASAELAATVFPRALQIHWGDEDTFYTEGGGREETERLLALADATGHAARLDVALSVGLGHAFDPALQEDFFRRALAPAPPPAVDLDAGCRPHESATAPSTETPAQPPPPDALAVHRNESSAW